MQFDWFACTTMMSVHVSSARSIRTEAISTKTTRNVIHPMRN